MDACLPVKTEPAVDLGVWQMPNKYCVFLDYFYLCVEGLPVNAGRGHWILWSWSSIQVAACCWTWVLGTELWSSGKATSVLNHQGISPAWAALQTPTVAVDTSVVIPSIVCTHFLLFSGQFFWVKGKTSFSVLYIPGWS